jgi:hypothetical protein
MKKTRDRRSRIDELRPEYAFDYSRSTPNRFAKELDTDTVAVVLEPDVARVFRTSEEVNTLLRSVLAAMPERSSAKTAAPRRVAARRARRREPASSK